MHARKISRIALPVAAVVWVLLLSHAGAADPARIEYIAHACFVIQSPQGVRIIIDPYNTNRHLGYHFPEGIQASAILVTHPRYDHDATYQLGFQIPAFRDPGHFRIEDVELEGLEGRYADASDSDFDGRNTVWVLRTGGQTFVHLGDNGIPEASLVQALGKVDVLMIPIESTFHVLSAEAVEKTIESIQPRLVVPMHYQIPELNDRIPDLGTVDPWLGQQDGVVRLEGNSFDFDRELPEGAKILVFRPSADVRPWGQTLKQAWRSASKGLDLLRKGAAVEAARHFQEATQAAPYVVSFWSGFASALQAQQRTVEAGMALERGLALAEPMDWQDGLGARLGLATFYLNVGRTGDARRQALVVIHNSRRPRLIEQARRIVAATRVVGAE